MALGGHGFSLIAGHAGHGEPAALSSGVEMGFPCPDGATPKDFAAERRGTGTATSPRALPHEFSTSEASSKVPALDSSASDIFSTYAPSVFSIENPRRFPAGGIAGSRSRSYAIIKERCRGGRACGTHRRSGRRVYGCRWVEQRPPRWRRRPSGPSTSCSDGHSSLPDRRRSPS
ncbi:MAG: hypothetical protein QOF09_1328 [Alphaproteobacteria bacterium]|nr:hypothetical protein [Alphaproteobacteria bacterium]